MNEHDNPPIVPELRLAIRMDKIQRLATGDLGHMTLRRDCIIPPEYCDENVYQNYDNTTLWYDAFWDAGKVTIIAPPLVNLGRHLKASKIFVDDVLVKTYKPRRFKYYEVLQVKAPFVPNELRVEIEAGAVVSKVNRVDLETFKGKNAILVKSKDNDLEWIRDFSLFHKRTQGAEAILFIDNGSTRYEAHDISSVMESAGLQHVVIEAPFKFGPDIKEAGPRYRCRAQFFQHAVLNIARLRFLSGARAVLSIDIDELVWSETSNVFDKAVANPFGYVSFRGVGRNPSLAQEGPARHADHLWGNAQSKPTGKLQPSHTKYAVAPGRLAGRLSWSVHRVGLLPLEHVFERRDCGFWHCSGISTGWRDADRLGKRGGVFFDTEMKRLMEEAALEGSDS